MARPSQSRPATRRSDRRPPHMSARRGRWVNRSMAAVAAAPMMRPWQRPKGHRHRAPHPRWAGAGGQRRGFWLVDDGDRRPGQPAARPRGRAPRAAPARLYALNALDGTLTPLDAERAAVAGPPLPAGTPRPRPSPGPDGSVLVLVLRARPARRADPRRPRPGRLAGAPVPLGAPLHEAALAADGGRYAAVAHHAPPRLAPEAESGRPAPPAGGPGGPLPAHPARPGHRRVADARGVRRRGAGSPGWRWERAGRPRGLPRRLGRPRARRPGPADAPAPRAAGSGRPPPPARPGGRPGRPHGARARRPRPGQPAGAPPARAARARQGAPEGRLYVLEGAPGPESDYSPRGRWRLLGLHPVTLETEQEAFLGVQVRALAVAPDGGHAYALAAGGKDVLHVDLATGVTRRLGALPGHASGALAVTARTSSSRTRWGARCGRSTAATAARPRPSAWAAGRWRSWRRGRRACPGA